MVEVFKTNVEELAQAKKIVEILLEQFPGHRINIDLHDCDKVLRVEGKSIIPETIVGMVTAHGFHCKMLE